jgi:hypothetical protein
LLICSGLVGVDSRIILDEIADDMKDCG